MKNQQPDDSTLAGMASRSDGMTMPEGYLADFAQRMKQSLPDLPFEHPVAAPRRSTWQKVRPYVYMAAMFAGIWCMMKMFDLMRPADATIPQGYGPELAAAMADDSFISDYYVTEMDESDIYDSLYDDGFTPASLSY